MNVNIIIQPNQCQIISSEQISETANKILEELTFNAKEKWTYYLNEKTEKTLDQLACSMLYQFYAPHSYEPPEPCPLYLKAFDDNLLNYKKQKNTADPILGDLPNGITYEIIPYQENLTVMYYFNYISQEDQRTQENLIISIVFLLEEDKKIQSMK